MIDFVVVLKIDSEWSAIKECVCAKQKKKQQQTNKQTNDSALKSTVCHTQTQSICISSYNIYLYKRCMPREKWIWNGIFISTSFCLALAHTHTHTWMWTLCWCFSMPKQNDETKTLKKINQHINAMIQYNVMKRKKEQPVSQPASIQPEVQQ